MEPLHLALACVFPPLFAFAVGLTVLRRRPDAASGLTVLCGVVSVAAAVALLLAGPLEAPVVARWISSGDVAISFGFLLDGPSLLMGVVVAFISLCIQIFSLGYMADDPGRARFFAFLGLFSWAMLSFVYAASLLQTFIFWELVGLASFLLIGFWYEKPSAVAAAQKAFIMTRIGDVGLFVGLILLLDAASTLDIVTICSAETIGSLDPGRLGLVTLLMFSGIVGKSAQFPLHTWLPDAMEGPTPVSALLHSATMVAAGVFLFARFHPLFMATPDTLAIVLGIAAFTAVLASTMAMVATDMKRVLAYSSISQLGYMLMALAAGGLAAGMFHLTTHAVFKALLFLCAGSFIHAAGTGDMVAMGRSGVRKMKTTTLALILGGGALAGIPPLAGFFSKEAVLHQVSGAGHTVIAGAGYLAAFLTAYYTFRMIFLLTRPNPDGKLAPVEPAGAQYRGDQHHGVHEPPWTMRGPIVLLAIGAVVVGFFGDAIGNLVAMPLDHPALAEMLPAMGVALAGVAVAWWDFGRSGASQLGFVARVAPVQRLFQAQWFIDAIYRRTVVRLALAVARGCYGFETRAVDGSADGLARLTRSGGAATARTQAGWIQIYIGTAVVIASLLALYLVVR